MRKAGILALGLLSLSACRREPDFDERYQEADAKVRDMAGQIDAQITGTGTPTSGVNEEER